MFQGVFSPVITVFRGSEIDYSAQERLVERLIAAGVNGILFCGSIGEFHAMPHQQKLEYLAWAARTVKGRVKALAGTGGTCVADVMDLTARAADFGLDGAVVMSPYYFRLDDSALYAYYREVTQVGLPVLLYNYPDRTGLSLSAELVRRLAEISAIAGIKDTVDTISHTREIIAAVKPVRPDFSILSGFDEYLVPNLMAGGDGILTGMTNVAPEVFVSLRQAFLAGQLSEVVRLQRLVNQLMTLYTVTNPFISAIKIAVDLVAGGISLDMLPPVALPGSRERQRVAEILMQAGLLV